MSLSQRKQDRVFGDFGLFLIVAAMSLSLCWSNLVGAQEEAKEEPRSGIELAGRSEKELPPYEWKVYDAATREQVGRVSRRWGFTPLPPGEYVVTVKPQGSYAKEIQWAQVTVPTDTVVPITVRSGIELSGRTEKEPSLYAWQVYEAGSDTPVAYVYKRWGFTPLPPGEYVVTVKPQGSYALEVRWAEVTVNQGEISTVVVSSGIELVGRAAEDTPLSEWEVYEPTEDRKVAYVYKRWGFTPLPAGKYTVQASLDNVTSALQQVLVEPHTVTTLTLGDLGLGQVQIELPAAHGILLASGSADLEVAIVQEDQVQPLSLQEGNETKHVSLWTNLTGPAAVRLKSGTLTLDIPTQVAAGETRHVPFDALALAAKYNLSLFGVTIRDAAGQLGSHDTQVMLFDEEHQQLLALTPNPSPQTKWLASQKTIVRARLHTREQVRRNIPVGKLSNVTFDFAPQSSEEEGPTGVQVDILIESPEEGTVVQADEVTLVGHASTTGPAGATRIALVLDASGSTSSSSGADLDGDGEEENILQAEVAAGQLLLDELEKIEAQGPGTTFEVAILCFGSRAKVMAPLTRVTDTKGVATLREALNHILTDRDCGGGTAYEAAFDEAVKALGAAEYRGESVILFMSDGAPNHLEPSLDTAARAGLTGTTIHTFGLGSSFRGEVTPHAAFPPNPRGGVNILATVAALGQGGGSVTPLPKPADVVQIIPRLPILELPEAELKEVQVVNATTGEPAFSVALNPDGSFQAKVPVSLLPPGTHEANTLAATAIALDGVSQATDQVRVRGLVSRGPGHLRVVATEPIPGVTASSHFELILDASGSMKYNHQRIDGRLKIDVAKDVMAQLITGLPDEAEVALRVYGHRVREGRKGDCQDSELIVPFRKLDRPYLIQQVQGIQALGTTPLAHSLWLAGLDVVDIPGRKHLVLVTDGKEECGGKPPDVASQLVRMGIDVRVDVVGFALADEETKQDMQRVAEITRGKYFDAQDAEELLHSLQRALAASYDVLDAQGKVVGSGRVGEAAITLPEGVYIVTVHAAGEPITVADVRVVYEQFTRVELKTEGQEVKTKTRVLESLPQEAVEEKGEGKKRLAAVETVEIPASTPEPGEPGMVIDPRIQRAQRLLSQVGFNPGPGELFFIGMWR